jgi:hypothetical protein
MKGKLGGAGRGIANNNNNNNNQRPTSAYLFEMPIECWF